MKLNRLLLLAVLPFAGLVSCDSRRAGNTASAVPENAIVLPASQGKYDLSRLKMEKLGRGLIAVRRNKDEVFVSWRYLSSDPADIAFNVYRDGQRINPTPVSLTTFYIDRNPVGGMYSVKPVVNGREKDEQSASSFTLPNKAPEGYINIALDKPADGVTPSGETYTYSPNDASVGDADGDGEYEIILKWDPSNSHDNAHDGYTGNVYFDCYKLDGTKLWRIDMGKNIRAGAHYTQFVVYDLDGDGVSELVMKTADGTVDGTGRVIGDANADWREKGGDMVQLPEADFRKTGANPAGTRNRGRIMSGPEYLTVFSCKDGAALKTIDYEPPRGDIMAWGDNYANRSDHYLAAMGFFSDDGRPSVVMCRGYYTRTVLACYDWDGRDLKTRWVFDTARVPRWKSYEGQGNHNLRVGDVDGDGKDEIVYGSCAIDHDGTGLYTTGLGHGDAMQMTQFAMDMPGLQVWCCHGNKRDGVTLRDAATGKILFQIENDDDVGRCMAADVDSVNPGLEMWAWSGIGMQSVKGETVAANPRGISVNMAVWWDGDLCRELLDRNRVSKYDYDSGAFVTMMTFDGCDSNNGTKATPCLQGDLFGDWREEVLMRTTDNRNLRLYVSTIPTTYRFHTFLEEPVYRISLALENICYNQPTQPGFYFGPDLFGSGAFFRGAYFPELKTVPK